MSSVVLPGSRVHVKMWADPATVEDQALAQLRNVANLPWVLSRQTDLVEVVAKLTPLICVKG